jgi:tetratricopeptide (TPR) repeat protein
MGVADFAPLQRTVPRLLVLLVAGAVALSAARSELAAQESALDSLRAAAKSSPADPAAALAYGRALRRAGYPVEALAEVRRGMAGGASQPSVLLELRWETARAQLDRHDVLQARAACKQIGGADGHACAADVHLLWQRATEALTETAAALAVDAHCYEAKVAQGRAYELQLDAPDAEAALRAAVAERAEGVDAHVALGRVLWKGGQKEAGLVELRKAVQLDKADPGALYELGTALAPSVESMTLLDRATRERRSFAQAWLALGTQELASGQVASAKGASDAALRGDPGSVAAHVLVGRVALAEGRSDDAIKEGEAALKILANSAAARLLVADGDARKGDLDLALEAYQAAWGLDHADPTPLVHASEACHAAGRDTSARAFAAKAVQEFPNWAPGWAALGDALAAQNEKPPARDAYRKALSVPDGSVDRSAIQRKLSALQ